MYQKTILRRPALAALLLPVLLSGLVGCGGRTRPAPTATATQSGSSATAVEATPEPTATAVLAPTAAPEPTLAPIATFEEAPCPFDVPANAAVDCGYVVVPEDHGMPDGPSIKLAVVVVKDPSDERQPDPLVLLAGGPGEKVVASAAQTAQFLALFAGNRDLILFDQRGVGLSEPSLDCSELVGAAFDLLDEIDPEVAMKAEFDALLACRDRLVADGHDLSVYTTAQSAADVAAIRQALGYEEINLYGGSYGSFLAQATMRDYPEGIRGVVLESVWPLETSLLVDRPGNSARMGLKLVDACTADPDCASAYPELRTVFFDVIDQLNAEPVPITVTNPLDGQSYAAVLTGDAVYGVLVSTFYQTQLIPALPQAIYDVSNGNYELMTQLSGARLMLLNLTSRGMTHSVVCAEDLVGRTPEEVLDQIEALPRQLRGRADPDLGIKYGIFGACEEWPVEEADPSFKHPLRSDIPTLVIAGEYDAVTPPEYARLVADKLSNSYLFEIPGAGHGGDTTSDCAVGIIATFLDDPSTAPDGSCIGDLPGLAFDLPSEPLEVALEPWSNEDTGLSGVAPVGWQELQPGTFARASSALDPVAMQVVSVGGDEDDLLGIVTAQFELAEAPERVGEREANDLTWSLYAAFEAQGVYRFLALAEVDGRTLVVVMRYDPEEGEALYSEVFLPVVDALVPIR